MRLIDADALKEWVEEYHTSNWGIPQDELMRLKKGGDHEQQKWPGNALA